MSAPPRWDGTLLRGPAHGPLPRPAAGHDDGDRARRRRQRPRPRPRPRPGVPGEHDRKRRLPREAVGQPELAARRQDTVRAFADLLAGLVLDTRPGLDPEAVATSSLVVVAGAVDAVGFWLENRIPTNVDGLVTRCARMVVAVTDQLATEQEER